jgi:nicotinamidase-related amidase
MVGSYHGRLAQPDDEKVNYILKEALLVIDVQNEYFTGRLHVTYPQGSLSHILQAMDAAHAAGIAVIVIRHCNPGPGAATFIPGTNEYELHPEVNRRPRDMIVDKTFPGSFTGTGLDEWLNEKGITSLTIAGYMTQMCCDTTARQAFHRGYRVTFLSDATGTLSIANSAGSVSDKDLHRVTLATQQMKFSWVTTTTDWIASLPISYDS